MTDFRYAEIKASVPKPDISPRFDVEDIHKIRYWHYDITKDLTREERNEYYSKAVEIYFNELKALGLPLPKTISPGKVSGE